MGCGSSKTLIKSVSARDKLHTPKQNKTSGYKEILVSRNGRNQVLTLLCTSSTQAKHLQEQESSKQSTPTCNDASQTKSFNSMASIIKEPEDSENDIETINSWELLAGLEDVDEIKELTERCNSKNLNTIKQCSESSRCDGIGQDDTNAMKQEREGEKKLKRKLKATELAALKVPAFEFVRAGSLRDWLMQGGQVMSNGSQVASMFGSFEHPRASGNGSCEDNVFHPDLVAQLEQAMEDLTVVEEGILNQIAEKWEGKCEVF